MLRIRRRNFITLLGVAAAAWPLAGRAQQPNRMRRVGVLMAFEEEDPRAKVNLSAFTRRLSESGWSDGRDIRMEVSACCTPRRNTRGTASSAHRKQWTSCAEMGVLCVKCGRASGSLWACAYRHPTQTQAAVCHPPVRRPP